MTALATDNFNRANNANLGTAWDVMTGEANLEIVSNQCSVTPGSTAADATESNNSVTWPGDQYSQVTFAQCNYTGGANDGVGIGPAVRCSTAARTYYRCCCAGTTANGTEIAKMIAGSYTALAHGGAAWVNTDTAYLSVVGTALTAKRNGSNVTTATDASIASGRPGISYSSSSSSGTPAVDNWEGGDLASTTVSLVPSMRHFDALLVR